MTGGSELACVVLAHADPAHLRRLVDALDPFPVFLHCDVGTSDAVFDEMTADLPSRATVLPRIGTGWAKWQNVAAELAGYRAALQQTDATHVALLTGSDYPLASSAEISALLHAHRGRSIARYTPLPMPGWGRNGGLDRLRYPHFAHRKRMIRIPVPRRLPADVVPAGGAQVKVLAREHAQAVVDVATARPDLVRFWRRSWIADETFVGSVLNSPDLVPGWAGAHVPSDLWWIGWDGMRHKSPPWLGLDHLEPLAEARAGGIDGFPRLFARKFSSATSGAVLDAIDRELRAAVPTR